MTILLFMLSTGIAASLDQLDIAGPYGTPTSSGAEALWWNPASLAFDSGTRFSLEGAYVTGGMSYQPASNTPSTGYHAVGIIPFLGVASDLTVPGLGVGVGVVVPTARGGVNEEVNPSGRYHMREGMIQHLQIVSAAAYRYKFISVGGSLNVVKSSFQTTLDTELVTQLDEAIADLGNDSGYTDELIEDPEYASTLEFDQLTDTAITYSVGTTVALPKNLTLGTSYTHGYSVKETGNATLNFSCPPQSDTLGRFGSESYGLCDTTLLANGSVAYSMPWRWQLGLAWRPNPATRVELMGGLVGWDSLDDYTISVSGVQDLNEGVSDKTADFINQTRDWARENQNSSWWALDVKYDLTPRLMVGGRLTHDSAAVPDLALSPNNYDADTTVVGALFGYKLSKTILVGLSVAQQFVAVRTINESGFGVTLDDEVANDDRWFYPDASGTYTGRVSRLAMSLRGRFGAEPQ